jgi:hypothetical protein
MTFLDHGGWSLPLWRFFRALLAMVVSLLLLAGAALEAGKRLQPSSQGRETRLVHCAVPPHELS